MNSSTTGRFTDAEFSALRQTIAWRGTVRMALVPLVCLGWAAVATAVLLLSQLPVAVLFPLIVLVGGFEAIHALHVGAERIGRYLQVSYESSSDGPRWETTAMKVGPALPGGGIDPLFSTVFAAAAVMNTIPALVPQPTAPELVVIAVAHLGFILRIVRARGAAARQRAVELESFRALLSSEGDRH
jgi:hypothetical protein